MEYEVIKNKIVYFKNVLPNHKEIVEGLEKYSNNIITDWVDWGNVYYSSVEQKSSSDKYYGVGKSIYDISYDYGNLNKESHYIYKSIDDSIAKCSDIYKEIMKIGDDNPRIKSAGYVVGKYYPDKSRGSHIDCPYDDKEHSYVLYINDDYEGGELHFEKLDVVIKPEAGSIIMFKSNDPDNLHQTYPLKSGYKYIIPHFWRMGPSQGFVPIDKNIQDIIDYSKISLKNDFENLKVVNARLEEMLKKND